MDHPHITTDWLEIILWHKNHEHNQNAAMEHALTEELPQSISKFFASEGRKLVEAINACPDPEAGFSFWQKYYSNPNYVDDTIALDIEHIIAMTRVQQIFRGRQQRSDMRMGIIDAIARAQRDDFEARFVSDFETFQKQAREPLIYISKTGVRRYLNDALAHHQRSIRTLHDEFARTLATAHKQQGGVETSDYAILMDEAVNALSFGVEFEFFAASDLPIGKTVSVLRAAFEEAALPVECLEDANLSIHQPKRENDYKAWRMTSDMSIRNPVQYGTQSSGIELISPVLKGREGLAAVHKALQIIRGLDQGQKILVLKDEGDNQKSLKWFFTDGVNFAAEQDGMVTVPTRDVFLSNQSCGYHVHVGVDQNDLTGLKNICKAWVKNESLFDQIIDESRRGHENENAKSQGHITAARIDACSNRAQLVNLMNPKKDGVNNDRFYKLDLTSLVDPNRPSTIQYRTAGGATYLGDAGRYLSAILRFTAAAQIDSEINVEKLLQGCGYKINSFSSLQKPAAKGRMEIK